MSVYIDLPKGVLHLFGGFGGVLSLLWRYCATWDIALGLEVPYTGVPRRPLDLKFPKTYFASSPETFCEYFFVFAWEFCIEKWRGFLVNLFWSPFPTKRSMKTPQKIGENSDRNSGQNPGQKFEKFGELSFCDFSDLTESLKKFFPGLLARSVKEMSKVPKDPKKESKRCQNQSSGAFATLL